MDEFVYSFQIWVMALHKHHLSISDAALLDIVRQDTQRFGFCFLSKEIIAKELNMTPLSVSNKLKRLIKKNLIERLHLSPEQRLASIKKSGWELGNKNKLTRTNCYRVTKEWMQYIIDNQS